MSSFFGLSLLDFLLEVCSCSVATRVPVRVAMHYVEPIICEGVKRNECESEVRHFAG